MAGWTAALTAVVRMTHYEFLASIRTSSRINAYVPTPMTLIL